MKNLSLGNRVNLGPIYVMEVKLCPILAGSRNFIENQCTSLTKRDVTKVEFDHLIHPAKFTPFFVIYISFLILVFKAQSAQMH